MFNQLGRSSACSASLVVLCFASTLVLDASAQSLPPGWTARDVGAPAIAGSASASGGTYIVRGAGEDVWGSSDQFTFVHRQLTGDGTITARVTALEQTNPRAKAGVMMRESLAGGAQHAFALVSAARGVALQRRATAGGKTATVAEAAGAAPYWVRLQREGSLFTAFRSPDGVTWSTLGSQRIAMSATILVGLAVTSREPSAAAQAEFANVAVGTPSSEGDAPAPAPESSLPTGWSSLDIGTGVLAGDARFAAGVFTLAGAGAGIGGTADQFRFAYRAVSGDVDLVARVDSIETVHAWSKAGLMIRRSLAAGAGHVSVFVTAGAGGAFQRRVSDGGQTEYSNSGSGGAPRWLKLSRRGSTITAYHSSDGTRWASVGAQSLALPSTFYVGVAVSSHLASSLADGHFSAVGVQATTVPVDGTNQPPTVSLTSPAAGTSLAAPATITVSASAADPDGTISRVNFWAGGTLLGTDTTMPYTMTWSGVGPGSYTIKAEAFDNAGARAVASSAVTVSGGNQPPMVSLTAPADGAAFAPSASITLSAAASDVDDAVARVEFYAGASLLGSDTTAPYSYGWNNVAAGSYSITAVARDSAGATTVSAARTVVVSDPQAPGRAIFTPSSNHATSVDRYVIDFFPSAADPAAANPVATVDVGKPAILNGECTADVSQAVASLAPGTYVVTVTAMGPGGTARSAASPVFVR